MNDDVLPELLKEVQAKFEIEFGKSKVVEDSFKKLKAKKATYSTANNFAIEVGEILARALQSVVTADRLPDGKMYYNIAKRLLEPVLGNNYKTVADYAVKVQSNLNKKAKIGLNAKKPFLNQDRINGFIDRLSYEDDFNKAKWLLGEPVVNFTQAVIDDTIKTNAEFQYSAGLNPTIERRTFGQCCKWCESLSGTYNYPHVPEDFYHRHQRCRCTIEYDPKTGRRQNSWSKKWYRSDRSELERRRKMNIDIRDNNRKSDILEYRKIVDVLGVEKSPISLAEFQDLKYNDSERYSWLKREERFMKELAVKEWSNVFKERVIEAFNKFKKNDISISVHAASRLPRLNNGKNVLITDNEVIDFIKSGPNYVEGTNKNIYFNPEKQLAIIQNKETNDIVSIVRRKYMKEGWSDVVRDDE